MTDIIAQGLENGWHAISADTLDDQQVLEADVVIVGSGAGGATSAEILSKSGLKVILVEEGKLRYQKDFKMDELEAFSTLYQEGTARKTKDGAIAIYQGRTVGGSTTVNWTSTFRTPDPTLEHWQKKHGVAGFSSAEMAHWFADRERQLNMSEWLMPPNANNSVLKKGCDALGWSVHTMIRNVKGCWNLGYCGFGCPTNAKQSMLVTSIPRALDNKATLLSCARVSHLEFAGDQVKAVHCAALDSEAIGDTGRRFQIRAQHVVLSAGAIGSPAVLMRSKAPDPYQTLGKRTFLHPVNTITAIMPEPIKGFEGAPQSIYSDEFLWQESSEAPGFKLEVAPVFPGGMAAQGTVSGPELHRSMESLTHANSMIALIRDGFHEYSQGGTVELRDDGSPVLNYPMTDYLWRGLRKAYHVMAEIQFAAGAKSLLIGHHDASEVTTLAEARRTIDSLPMEPLRPALFSAHVMGGCGMGEDPGTSVVNSRGRHHQISNLSVIDGACFPTSIGANPQLSIYALAAKMSSQLASELSA